MTMVLSWVELMYFPSIAVAAIFAYRAGIRHAMNDETRALYWRRRARSAEGQLRKARASATVSEVQK